MEVKGHLCEGLRKYQEYALRSNCVPNFTEEGFTEGCDDTNYIPLKYCPFCTEKLQPSKLYKCKCKNEDCNHSFETYDKWNDCCMECYSSNLDIEIIEE